MARRKSLSKSKRYAVFARDAFTCRYCGRQAGTVVLVVDHVVPVARGGDNDPTNLITSCEDCNAGKGANSPATAVPTTVDLRRLQQERADLESAAHQVVATRAARAQYEQAVVNCLCDITGRDSFDNRTLTLFLRYLDEFGDQVFGWVEIAHRQIPGGPDWRLGKYVSGIRRNVMQCQREAEQLAAQGSFVGDPAWQDYTEYGGRT